MPTVAAVDYLIEWPPYGGGFVDLFLSLRGISENPGWNVYLISRARNRDRFPANTRINFIYLPDDLPAFAAHLPECLDTIHPDCVILGNSWNLKVRSQLVDRMLKYPLVFRNFTHEGLCTHSIALKYIHDAYCPYNFITNRWRCGYCAVRNRRWLTTPFSYFFSPRYARLNRQMSDRHHIVYNDFIRSQYEMAGFKHIHVIPGLFDSDLFHPRDDVARTFSLFFSKKDKPHKGWNIVEQARGRLNDLSLRILVTDTHAYHNDNLVSVGKHPHHRMPELYRQSIATVMASHCYESFGITVIESMACGTPVIAPDLPHLNQLIRHGYNGLLYPARDSQRLAECIRTLVAKPATAQAMRGNCLESARQYDYRLIANHYYLPVLRAIIS